MLHSSQGFLPEFPKGVRLSTGGYREAKGRSPPPLKLDCFGESRDRQEMVWDNEEGGSAVRPACVNFSLATY